ncbi:IS110 family transposase [Sphingomonas sp. Tas61C01]|uniref:IS110 family transposase n=1 Tax=Sphingomonas sp. Tas61C01 TaxID=3458297 RepID=UPI00403E7F9E
MHDSATIPDSFIGCDVGKAEIVVFDSRSGRTTRIANDPQALADFAGTLEPTGLVVCEATGGYEAGLLNALVAAGRPVHRADARKVKAFIRSFGILGKTDGIDARALAAYGRERHGALARWQPRDEQRDQLALLVSTRRECVRQRVACRNRLQAPGTAPVAPRLQRILATLDAEIAGIDADIATLIDACEPLNRAATTLRAIPGIGPATAAQLVALMPELGTLGRRQAAALAGLAPHPRQSGSHDAYRRTRGGRPEVKQALFMAGLAAARHNPTLKSFYKRLIANGKKPIVALVAVMRKLLVIANARIRDTMAMN